MGKQHSKPKNKQYQSVSNDEDNDEDDTDKVDDKNPAKSYKDDYNPNHVYVDLTEKSISSDFTTDSEESESSMDSYYSHLSSAGQNYQISMGAFDKHILMEPDGLVNNTFAEKYVSSHLKSNVSTSSIKQQKLFQQSKFDPNHVHIEPVNYDVDSDNEEELSELKQSELEPQLTPFEEPESYQDANDINVHVLFKADAMEFIPTEPTEPTEPGDKYSIFDGLIFETENKKQIICYMREHNMCINNMRMNDFVETISIYLQNPAIKSKLKRLYYRICDRTNDESTSMLVKTVTENIVDISSETAHVQQEVQPELKTTNDYKIKINKFLTKQMLPYRAIEEFSDVKTYMEQVEKLYGTQFIKVLYGGCHDGPDGSKAILNYNFHCKDNGEILYVLCNKQNDGNLFKHAQLCTADELKQQYNIKVEQLPRICHEHMPQSLRPSMPNIETRTIRQVLHDKAERDKLITSTEWTRIVVHKWYHLGIKPVSIPVEVTEQEFIKTLRASADSMESKTQDGVELIPIIEPDTRRIQYAWVVSLNHNRFQFNIGISLKFSKRNTNSISVSAIYMSLFDVHQLAQFHHDTNICTMLDNFDCDYNDLCIGQGKDHRIDQLEKEIEKLKKKNQANMKQKIPSSRRQRKTATEPEKYSLQISQSFSVNITHLTHLTPLTDDMDDDDISDDDVLSKNTKTPLKCSTPLNPNCNEFIPGITALSNTAKLPSILEENDENLKYNL